MNINEFISERKDEWERLESLTKKLRPGSLQKLSRQDLWDLGRLYFAAVSDLSVLKSSELAVDTDNEIINYLNSQVASIHGLIYRKPRLTWAAVIDFFISGFPRAFRAEAVYIATAAAVLIISRLDRSITWIKGTCIYRTLGAGKHNSDSGKRQSVV